jgi:hypothetical protein
VAEEVKPLNLTNVVAEDSIDDSSRPADDLIAHAAALVDRFRAAIEALKTPVKVSAKADSFVMVDNDGHVRAEIAMSSSGGPSVTLYDAGGRKRAAIALSDRGEPSIQLHNDAGNQRAELALRADGVVGLGFYDSEGAGRAEFFVAADGTTALYLMGSNGERIAELPLRVMPAPRER